MSRSTNPSIPPRAQMWIDIEALLAASAALEAAAAQLWGTMGRVGFGVAGSLGEELVESVLNRVAKQVDDILSVRQLFFAVNPPSDSSGPES